MTTQQAVKWTIFWVFTSCLVGALVFWFDGQAASMTFFTVYLIEKTLSFDNLFVFLLIFSYFKTPDSLKRRILTIGIWGAVVFRAIFIFSGSLLFEQFAWLLYVLGAVLVYLGGSLFFGGQDDEADVANMWAVRFAKKHLSVENEYCRGDLTTKRLTSRNIYWTASRKPGYFSLTFLVIVVVEISDIIFAIDSVPAAFAITNEAYLIYTANICAILGLRSMYFVMDSMIHRLRFINYGVGLILSFIGVKILISNFVHIDAIHSMAGILTVLAITFIASYFFPKKEACTE